MGGEEKKTRQAYFPENNCQCLYEISSDLLEYERNIQKRNSTFDL